MSAVRVVRGTPAGPPPKVSILVTTYNHERYLAEALDSALAQETTFPFEIIVGEDCSTDGTRDVLLDYHARHPDVIRMVLPERNLGVNEMYIEVMRAARGEYYAILDGDDYWTSTDKLERQARFLDANQDHQVVFHDVTVLPESGRGPARPGMPSLGRDTFTLEDVLLGDFVPTSSVMHRRLEVDDLPEWFTRFAWIDWLTLVWCAQRGPLGCLDDLSSVYRVHGAGLWSAMRREDQIAEEIRVYEHLRSILPERHGGALRAGLQRCKVQQAVERAGLRHDRHVAVLSEPPGLPWYFNGRPVWQVDCSEESDEAQVLAELGRLRRSPRPAPSAPHWRVEGPARPDDGESVYCVVPSREDLFQRFPGLRACLGSLEPLIEDGACAVYEFPVRDVREREVTHVRVDPPLSDELYGGHIDQPRPGTATTGGMLEVIGWVLPKEASPFEVRVTYGDQDLARTATPTARPDLAAAFPDVPGAGTAGFRLLVDLADLPSAAELAVLAALGNGRRVVLANILTEEAPASG